MKVWYPYNYTDSKCHSINEYIMSCTLDMSRFKLILMKNIISERWKLATTKLNNLLHTDTIKRTDIPDSYINALMCGYDPVRGCCYYYISPFRKVGNTIYSLIKTIRLCEYGNDTIPPCNWIRHSYNEFVDTITGDRR